MAFSSQNTYHDDGNDYNKNCGYHGYEQVQISHEKFNQIFIVATTDNIR